MTAAELARIGGRAPGTGSLTPTERNVAELVAQGHTNTEVAALLFLSAKIVAAHLTHVYAKLDLRSRSELAAAWPTVADKDPLMHQARCWTNRPDGARSARPGHRPHPGRSTSRPGSGNRH